METLVRTLVRLLLHAKRKKSFVNKIPDQIDYELEVNIYFDNAFTHMDTSPKESNQYSEYEPGMDT